jgi:hypothetical protein
MGNALNNLRSKYRDVKQSSKPKPNLSPGFALVITLSLMILLAILAVGLISLSAVSLRVSGQGSAQAEARANARMALMVAIGELQKHAGPDTRVTAPSGIVDENSPPLVGVWKSWEGSNHETSGPFAGRPISPDYYSKTQGASNGGRFLTWLVSGARSDGDASSLGELAASSPGSNSIPLLASGTLGKDAEGAVHLVPQPFGDSGTFAWWVSGENQKARLPVPYKPKNENSVAGWSDIARSHAVSDPEPFGLDNLLDDSAPAAKAISLGSVDFITKQGASPAPRESFHHLSIDSVGLLTNTATGGWRKDLSLLTENWDSQPKTNLPFFRLTPNNNAAGTIPTVQNSYPVGAMLYPWASYRTLFANAPIYRQGAVSSWENLKDFATHYKRASTSAGGVSTTPLHYRQITGTSPANNFEYIHRVRVVPVVARIQWIFSHSAALRPKGNPSDPNRYEPRVLLTPVITMWNPYNVQITSPAVNISLAKAMPAALKYTINGTENPKYHSVMAGQNNQPSLGGGSMSFNINTPFTLIPGETRTFSPLATTPVASGAIALSPGFRPGGGHFFPVKGPDDKPMSIAGNSSIKVDAKFDTTLSDHGVGVGTYLDVRVGGTWTLAYRMFFAPEMANVIYPPLTDLAEVASGSLPGTVTNPTPFLSTIFGARTASNTNFPAKGLMQSSPFVNYTVMGLKGMQHPAVLRHYGGTGHPVSATFDYSFVKHAGAGDSFMPNVDPSNRGYIVTGFTQADGLSRCIIAELPLRPLASLAELTHWDARYENCVPPYALNIVANSDASPLLPSDQVVNYKDKDLKVNLQYDDSYCANHLLFDDWFLSSITPDPGNFGATTRTQKQTHSDFLTGAVPLANRAYRPIREDAAATDPNALFSRHIEPVDAWKTIASRLEVEGMFNVNSTSVTAWRALLGHARGQKVARISGSGGGWNAGLSDATDHAWSRFSIAADTEAGKPGTSGAFPEATEFTGYRTVDDDYLDALAEEIVAQVRARGPFLSLSEFVNRQLSSGDLALAGTIQAALNKLSENNATDPFKVLKDQNFSSVAVTDPPSPANTQVDEEFQFRAAGGGHSTYGLPGWIRQADVLRPLAPILSARDDTFTIRAYGDSRDQAGKVLAKAWCEASVRRTRDFVDPTDPADTVDAPTSNANVQFGRRFVITSFRWLSHDEI